MLKWQRYHTAWFVMSFGWMCLYLTRIGLSPILTTVRSDLGLSYAQAGILATAILIAYNLMQFPSGFLGDKFGNRTLLLCGVIFWAVFTFLTGFATSFGAFFALRFLTGIGTGVWFANDRPIVSACTPPEKLTFGQAISLAGAGVGIFLGNALGGAVAEFLGWRYVFFLFSIPSLLEAVFIWRLIEKPRARSQGAPLSKANYGEIFKNKDILLLSAAGFTSMYGLWLLGAWAPAMLQEAGVKEIAKSSVYAGLLGLAALPGLFFSGFVSDKFVEMGRGRKFTAAFQMAALALTFFFMGRAIGHKAGGFPMVVALLFAGAFVWGQWAPLFTMVVDLVPQRLLSTAYGFINSIIFAGAFFSPWFAGLVKDLSGSFAWGAYSAAIALVLGTLAVLSIRPAFKWRAELAHPERLRAAP